MMQMFRGRTLDEATRAATTALGAEAVVVATRKVSKTGIAGMLGGSEIEVSAHVPPKPAPVRTRLSQMLERLPFSEGVYAEEEPGTGSGKQPVDDFQKLRNEIKSELRAVRLAATRNTGVQQPGVPMELANELAAMRALMDELLAPAQAKKASRLQSLLETRGIEGPVATAVTRRMKADKTGDEETDLKERLRDAISEEIRVMPWPVAHEGRAIVALVGPAGVGKTTTAAKLAAHAIRSGKSVTLVGADAFRVGAANQLERYAHLLGAHFEVAATAGELGRVLARNDSDLVIVDTSGQALPEPNAPEAFIQRSAEGEGLDGRARYVLLCVPGALRAGDARRVASRYGAMAPTGIVVTKLDETDAPAGLLHISYATRLPTAALCFGPQVPEAIAPASHGAILDHLVPRKNARKESGR